MQFLIWGAGAIGGTLGAHLARAGHDVTFVDQAAEHVAAINARGLQICGPVSEFVVPAKAKLPDEVAGEYEHIILAVKAQDTERATKALSPLLAELPARRGAGGEAPTASYVVSAQNGLNELVIAEMVGAARTIGCFVNFGADYLEPGVIQFGGRGAVVVGELDGRITPRLEELHRAFQDFEPNAIITDNIWGYLWGKLGYGAQLFATALTNDSIADALADPAFRDLYIKLAREALSVALARGVKPEAFNGFDPHAFMPGVERAVSERSLDEMVAFNRKSAKTHSGIWRDIAVRKRRTEADPQLGPIVALGKAAGVPTPLTARLIALIHDVEEGRRAQGRETLELLRAAGA